MSGTDRRGGLRRWLAPPVRHRRWHPRDVRLLRKQTGADVPTCERWSTAIRGRLRRSKLIAGIAGAVGTLVWLFIVGFGPPRGDGLARPVLEWMERAFANEPWFDAAQITAAVLLWFGPCLIWGAFCEHRLWHARVRRDLRSAMRRPVCLSCGYDCVGLPGEAGRVACPECGERTPVITDPARD